ncbi:TetR/AcrR family transcriptional regulator [Amycolatopsis sp. NPDC023774]|uniref:TetR/AcrR family transcriptional regulator n=1 Tax=Amycolatopsis sp. NPDC023774 TaxID=3155015 RepID=UPI0033D21997
MFDERTALRAAMFAFWRYGYEGASMAVLMDATGLGKTSPYRTFGNKETLSRRAVDVYHEEFLAFREKALQEPTPRRIVERLLFGLAELHGDDATPPGCLETTGALTCGPDNVLVHKQLIANRELITAALEKRLAEVTDNGALPPGLGVAETVALVVTILQGMAVQAVAGRSTEWLRGVVRSVLTLWGPAD